LARNPGMYNYRGLRGIGNMGNMGQGMYQDGPRHPIQGLGQNGEPLSVAKSNAAQRALEQREIVKSNIGENIWTDLTSGKTYKISPFTITARNLDAALSAFTAQSSEQTIGTFTVPVGTELMFAKPRFARGDIESPHIFANLTSNGTAAINDGVFRVRVFDSQAHFEKFIPLEVSMEKLNAASAIDIDQRVYFNSQTPGRAVSGDVIRLAIDPQGGATTFDTTNARVVLELIRLSVLAG